MTWPTERKKHGLREKKEPFLSRNVLADFGVFAMEKTGQPPSPPDQSWPAEGGSSIFEIFVALVKKSKSKQKREWNVFAKIMDVKENRKIFASVRQQVN